MNSVYVVTYEYDDGTMWLTKNLKVYTMFAKAEEYILSRIASEHDGDESYEQ